MKNRKYYYWIFKYRKDTKSKEPFILYLQKIKKQIIESLEEEDIELFNDTLLLNKNFKFWDPINNEPEMNLFYWCVFSNRIEIAKLFWKIGKVYYYSKIYFKHHPYIKKVSNTKCTNSKQIAEFFGN